MAESDKKKDRAIITACLLWVLVIEHPSSVNRITVEVERKCDCYVYPEKIKSHINTLKRLNIYVKPDGEDYYINEKTALAFCQRHKNNKHTRAIYLEIMSYLDDDIHRFLVDGGFI